LVAIEKEGTMKQIYLTLVLGLVLAPLTGANADSAFPLMNLQESQQTMQGHYKDDATTVIYSVKQANCNGVSCFYILWDSEVKRIETWLKPDGWPIRTVYQKLKTQERVEIEYTNIGATYRYSKDGKSKTTQIKEKELIESLMIDVMLLSYPFEKPQEKVAYFIDADSDKGSTYRLFAKLDGIEEVMAAGTTQKAYKIKVGVKGVAGLFAPTFYFWYSVEKPHRYLKYQGPDEQFVLVSGEIVMQ
jgi:hypothetical protein